MCTLYCYILFAKINKKPMMKKKKKYNITTLLHAIYSVSFIHKQWLTFDPYMMSVDVTLAVKTKCPI